MNRPSQIAIDDDGLLYVTEKGGDRVQIFTTDGHSVGTFGSRGDGPGGFDQPFGIDIDPQGRVIVADWQKQEILVFTRT